MTNLSPTILEAKGIGKSFPGVRALDGVDFDLRRGEVHVLLGENGAGKTTLVKILAGAIRPDQGQILLDSKPITLRDPRAAQERGIATVYQELTLIPALTVAENVFLGNLPRKRGLVDWNYLHHETDRILKGMGCTVDPKAQCRNVGIAARQMTEIAKALARRATVLILDEPTSALTESERDRLFELLRRLQAEGTAILYISHRLEELSEIGTRITVLRDGMKVGTVDAAGTAKETLVRMMLGREWADATERSTPPGDEMMLELSGVSSTANLHEVNLVARRGEIIGLAGLMGAGRTELARCLFGVDRATSGKMRVAGQDVRVRSPRDAISLGIGYLTEGRDEGLIMAMSVAENITLSCPRKIFRRVLLDRGLESRLVAEQVKNLNIRAASVRQLVKYLSGGNQQKVALARWLCSDARILILDDPTRGIDIGAKEEIYKLVTRLAESGITILYISSEFRELLRVAHRIVVMFGGRIVGEMPQSEATLPRILMLATGGVR